MKDPLLAIAVFLLGASVGALLTMIHYRQEIALLKTMLEKLFPEGDSEDGKAA